MESLVPTVPSAFNVAQTIAKAESFVPPVRTSTTTFDDPQSSGEASSEPPEPPMIEVYVGVETVTALAGVTKIGPRARNIAKNQVVALRAARRRVLDADDALLTT